MIDFLLVTIPDSKETSRSEISANCLFSLIYNYHATFPSNDHIKKKLKVLPFFPNRISPIYTSNLKRLEVADFSRKFFCIIITILTLMPVNEKMDKIEFPIACATSLNPTV